MLTEGVEIPDIGRMLLPSRDSKRQYTSTEYQISLIRCCCRAVLSLGRCDGSLLLRDVENLVSKLDEQIPALDKI